MTCPDAVKTMANWYAANVHTYQGGVRGSKNRPKKGVAWIPCPLINQNIRDDCTGYTVSCLQLFGILPKGYAAGSAEQAKINGGFATKLSKAGFKVMRFSSSVLQPFDIAACYIEGGTHHAEIYAGLVNGKRRSFSWGNVNDNANGGQPTYCNIKDNYQVIYRYDGVARDIPLNFTMDSSGGSYGGGGTVYINLDDYIEPYPVHSEYDTYTGKGGNIFSNDKDNAFGLAGLKDNTLLNNKLDEITTNSSIPKYKHTRIYSTNDATIVLDELRLPMDISTNDTWANKGITMTDVSAWKEAQDKQTEEAKKAKAEEEAKNSSTNSSTGNTSTGNTSTGNTSTGKK